MNEHILLVEDEDALSLMLSDRLQTEGYVVNRARDGNEGLKKATA
jgi:DNA-binding response OmpR family regulator